MTEVQRISEAIQHVVVKLLATNPVGYNLRLIGGFRYRLLDQSARLSSDIDYHWEGDLDTKQQELIALFDRRLLPEIKRQWGYEGNARAATGPNADSPALRIVELAFWRPGMPNSRIEIPVEITRIVCLDSPAARTANGVVYPTASDADLIESKVIALLNRQVTEHRDFCDVFLFSSHLAANAAERLHTKLTRLGISQEKIARRLGDFITKQDFHIRQIQGVVDGQLDPAAAANINAAGGAKLVYQNVLEVLLKKLRLSAEVPHEGQ